MVFLEELHWQIYGDFPNQSSFRVNAFQVLRCLFAFTLMSTAFVWFNSSTFPLRLSVSFVLHILFQHMHVFYKTHDCPFHENQAPWRGRAPVFKSCLASGRQPPPGRLPPLSAVVERAIWAMERSVFPISRWFPLPCTPPCSLAPSAASGTAADWQHVRARLIFLQRIIKGMIERLRY